MTRTLPITKAREELTTLVDNAHKRLDDYVITVNGIPAAVLISAAEYDSWKETNEIMSNPGLVKAIRKGENEIDKGKGIPWEDVKNQLDVD